MKNLTELRDSMLIRAGNLSEADPVIVAAGNGVDFVNEGIRFLVTRTLRGDRRRLNLFPELRERTPVKTVADTATVDMPDDFITIDEVYSYDETGASAPD